MQIGALLRKEVDTRSECEAKCAAHKDCKSYAYYVRRKYCALSAIITQTPSPRSGEQGTSNYETFSLATCESSNSIKCQDTNDGATGWYQDRGCDYYTAHPDECDVGPANNPDHGDNYYNDNDFQAHVMCCACGGGEPVPVSKQCFNPQGSGYIDGPRQALFKNIATVAECQAQCAASKECKAFSHSVQLKRCALSRRVPTEILMPDSPSGNGRAWHIRYTTFSLGDCAPDTAERCFQGVGQGYIDGARLGQPVRSGVDTREACEARCASDLLCQAYAYNEARKHCTLSSDTIGTPQTPTNGGKTWTKAYQAYTVANCSSIDHTPVGKCFDLVGTGYFDGRRAGKSIREGVETLEKCQEICVVREACKAFAYNRKRRQCDLSRDAVGKILLPDTGGKRWSKLFETYTARGC